MKVTLPPVLLRTEGATLLALSALLYGLNEGNWLLFVLLFLVPDVSMLGYRARSRELQPVPYLRRARSPAPLGLLAKSSLVVSAALVWFAHRVRQDGWLRAEVPHGV